MIQNYIFDFDGTIADTIGGITATMQETFRQHGMEVPEPEKVKGVVGLPLAGCMRGLGISDETLVDDMCTTYRRLFPDIATSKIDIFPEVKETLTELNKQGKKLAVATSRNIESLTQIMKRHGIYDFFETIVTATDNLTPKPAPDMVLALLERMGISEKETMVIGDTTFDIQMGNGAHCWTCAVTYGNHTREQLLTAEPNFIIDRFSDIVALK